jgi:aminopeptidase N
MTSHIKYRKNYKPSEFNINHIDLTFDIDVQSTKVHSRMSVRVMSMNPQDLYLNGTVELERLCIDGVEIPLSQIQKDDHGMFIRFPWSDQHVLDIHTKIYPQKNTDLMGLYVSAGHLLTQCEPEGFRKITYFLDRPDIMATYTTTIVADQRLYPVLLSNGNLVDHGVLDHHRHWVKWHDPFPKPSYLFAMVAARLTPLRDEFITRSGRRVDLEVWVESRDLYKAHWAMESLKRAMRWDEERFGLEYDLDRYMIVATGDFNMGAMENKGLNIFNTKYILAHQNTETDADFEAVEAVIGHEYFHNWTGNRVTCRDWFQLSLKEGLTVFRDQEFTSDQTSRSVKRIKDVRMLRQHQFTEDSGPMAHPIRPESYIEMNNFYTMTVYEKGAEVVRMYQTLLGRDGFLKGMNLYFQRHDGQAVTCDDFRRAMADANGVDLTQFGLWYSQSGTPTVYLRTEYDAMHERLSLHLKQVSAPTADQEKKDPLHIPFAVGLLAQNGSSIMLESPEFPRPLETQIIELTSSEYTLSFENVPQGARLSVLRGFSAPVRLIFDQNEEDLCFLMSHDSDSFARWEAGQRLMKQYILSMVKKDDSTMHLSPEFLEACKRILEDPHLDPAFQTLMLTLPSVQELCDEIPDQLHPDRVVHAHQEMQKAIARALSSMWLELYQKNINQIYDYKDSGRRALKIFSLHMGCVIENEWSIKEAQSLYHHCDNMTDRLGALTALRVLASPLYFREVLDDFSNVFAHDSLAMDKYFQLLAGRLSFHTLADVQAAQNHPAFLSTNPNKVRALLGGLGQNPLAFHRLDGASYQFMADEVIRIQYSNGSLASRLVSCFNHWRKMEDVRRDLMRQELERIASVPNLARDVAEIVGKALV